MGRPSSCNCRCKGSSSSGRTSGIPECHTPVGGPNCPAGLDDDCYAPDSIIVNPEDLFPWDSPGESFHYKYVSYSAVATRDDLVQVSPGGDPWTGCLPSYTLTTYLEDDRGIFPWHIPFTIHYLPWEPVSNIGYVVVPHYGGYWYRHIAPNDVRQCGEDGSSSSGGIELTPTCEGCECVPEMPPPVAGSANPITVEFSFPGNPSYGFTICLPRSGCQTTSVSYEASLPGCSDVVDLNLTLRCIQDGGEYGWVLIVSDAKEPVPGEEIKSQQFPVSFDENFEATITDTLDIFCGTSISTNIAISVDSCPVCDPVLSPSGVLKLIGNIGGSAFDVCLIGPVGISYEGAWSGTIRDFQGATCSGKDISFEVYCKDLGGGVTEWTLSISDGTETAELPIEWYTPLSAQGDASGPVDLCGETGLAFVATISMFTEADDPGHPAMRCCNPDIIQQCDLPNQLKADATPVPFQFDPCSVSNCDGIVRTMSLTDTPLECNGNPIGLTGYSPGDKYFIADFPATTHPVDGANAFYGHKLLVWCDGSNMRWARLDENGCVHLTETGAFTTWDCETFSGTIEYNFDGSQDCCDGFGLTRWNIEVGNL